MTHVGESTVDHEHRGGCEESGNILERLVSAGSPACRMLRWRVPMLWSSFIL